MPLAINVENLSKTYAISHKSEAQSSLKEQIEDSIRRTFGMLPRKGTELSNSSNTVEAFKALDDVSFQVAQGERLAVIGQNGAGKSTLLKILSRITEPTSGRITVKGRVSSLLEVGTGFHPELTGRENIFLNGAVLGMSKGEIRRKFDEIVAFSEVEKFIDTAVKYYSSGMYVRLAFSVAAHLDPDVLILDEVLAVGDVKFQQKCLEQMKYASHEGRTVLFVSHGMQAVMQICPHAVLLEHGRIVANGPTPEVITAYMGVAFLGNEQPENDSHSHFLGKEQHRDDTARLIEARLRNSQGTITSALMFHDPGQIEMDFEILRSNGEYFVPNFHLYSAEGVLVGVLTPREGAIAQYEVGKYTAVCMLPRHLINEGVYRLLIALSSWREDVRVHFEVKNAITFKVVDDLSDMSYRNGYLGSVPGLIRPMLEWQIRRVD